MRPVHRVLRRIPGGRLVVALAVALGVAGCSTGGNEGITMVTSRTSTTFVTLPPPSTTVPPAVADEGDANGGSGPSSDPDAPRGEEVYTVVNGDYLLRIARRFDLDVDALVEFNGWEGPNHPLYTGDEVRIPPEGYDPGATIPTGSTPATSEPGDAATCPDGSEPDTYTIRAGDTPRIVARRLGVTVDELDAANADTRFYAGFVIGIKIIVPC